MTSRATGLSLKHLPEKQNALGCVGRNAIIFRLNILFICLTRNWGGKLRTKITITLDNPELHRWQLNKNFPIS